MTGDNRASTLPGVDHAMEDVIRASEDRLQPRGLRQLVIRHVAFNEPAVTRAVFCLDAVDEHVDLKLRGCQARVLDRQIESRAIRGRHTADVEELRQQLFQILCKSIGAKGYAECTKYDSLELVKEGIS